MGVCSCLQTYPSFCIGWRDACMHGLSLWAGIIQVEVVVLNRLVGFQAPPWMDSWGLMCNFFSSQGSYHNLDQLIMRRTSPLALLGWLLFGGHLKIVGNKGERIAARRNIKSVVLADLRFKSAFNFSLVGEVGLEPTKAYAERFTVSCHCR